MLVGPSLLTPWTLYAAGALRRLGQTVDVVYSTDRMLDRLTLHQGKGLARFPGLGDKLRLWRERWLQQRDQRIYDTAKGGRPDLILILWGNTLSADLLRRLKSISRSPVATWWVDDPFRHSVEPLLPLYDFFFIFDRSYLQPLRQAGVRRPRFLPCACDETVYRPMLLNRLESRRYGSDVSLIGWYYPNRAKVVQALDGFNVRIWGREWADFQINQAASDNGRTIVSKECFLKDAIASKIYNGTKIGLNIHSDQTREGGLNTRSFELLAAGAFELTDAVAGMEELLTPGQEVAVYRSPEEARERVRYYLAHPNQRAEIANRGRARVLSEHTFTHRMRALLKEATS